MGRCAGGGLEWQDTGLIIKDSELGADTRKPQDLLRNKGKLN